MGGRGGWIVKSKLNKFEHDQSSRAGPCTDSFCSDPVQCTVRSKLNKFEHVGGGSDGPCREGVVVGIGALYRGWAGLGP